MYLLFIGLILGWISCLIVVFSTRAYAVYKLHKEALAEVVKELSIIRDLSNSKLEEVEGEFLMDYELLLPDNAYRKALSAGAGFYMRKGSVKFLKKVYTEVNMLNQFFERDETGDPHKLYSVVKEVSENSEKAEKLVKMELEQGTYSSFLDFLRQHNPSKSF